MLIISLCVCGFACVFEILCARAWIGVSSLFQVLWLCRIPQLATFEKVFSSLDEFLSHLPVTRPPKEYQLDHLTFVGRAKNNYEGGLFDASSIKVRSRPP